MPVGVHRNLLLGGGGQVGAGSLWTGGTQECFFSQCSRDQRASPLINHCFKHRIQDKVQIYTRWRTFRCTTTPSVCVRLFILGKSMRTRRSVVYLLRFKRRQGTV